MYREGMGSIGEEFTFLNEANNESPPENEGHDEPLPELVSGSEGQIEDRLNIWKDILAKGYTKEIKIDGQVGPDINFVLTDKNGNQVSVTERLTYGDSYGYQLDVFSGGKNIGFLRYQAGSGNTPISMGRTSINPEFRKLGLNTLLFQHMTKLHPEAENVWSKMDLDNWEEYDKTIRDGKTPEEAINSTPAGKVRIRAGWELDLEKSILPILENDGEYASAKVRPVYKKKDDV